MNANLPGCIDHEQIETPSGTVYRWPNPDFPSRWIETRDPLLVPLSRETQAHLEAATEAHHVACDEAGYDETDRGFGRDGYDPRREIYRETFRRIMESR